MSGYTKLFSRILDSTIWREDDPTRILWVTMLAIADQDGIVQCTIPGLADRARITLEQCESALLRFQQPDKYSWSKEAEGRRITEVDGGWLLINHAKYRALMCAEEQREKTRLRVERWRKRKEPLQTVTAVTSNQCNDKHIAEAKADTKAIKSNPLAQLALSEAEIIYQIYPRKVGKGSAIKSILSAIKRVEKGEYKGGPLNFEKAVAGIKHRTTMFADSTAGKRGQFTPHPTTWFNRSSYLEDPKEWETAEEVPDSLAERNKRAFQEYQRRAQQDNSSVE